VNRSSGSQLSGSQAPVHNAHSALLYHPGRVVSLNRTAKEGLRQGKVGKVSESDWSIESVREKLCSKVNLCECIY